MPAIAESPNAPKFYIPAEFGSECRPEPQGETGKGLLRNAEAVFLQWNEPVEALNAFSDDGDDVPYAPLPLEPVFYAKVRYKYVGKMKSIPYPFDD